MTSDEHYLFVTGRLAEHSLRSVVEDLAPQVGFTYSVRVMPINIAALMTPKWVARRLEVPPGITRVLLPGYCDGDLSPVEAVAGVPVERGPRDLRQLPEFFGPQWGRTDYGEHDIQILAEIRSAPRSCLQEILRQAERLESHGADLIVLGCEPNDTWSAVGDVVRALVDQGRRVSIHSFNPAEIEPAVRAGVELVLSVNNTNRPQACDWGCEVVAVPDTPGTLNGLEETLELLTAAGVPVRIDPGLDPIGFGLARSLGRYLEVRRRWPDAEMLMPVGSLTEATGVDSAGIHVLLLGLCQELGIRSVLTTQQANWTRTAVRECDSARRLARYAVTHHLVPKHVEPGLLILRDPRVLEHGPEGLEELASAIEDPSCRIFAEGGRLHVISAGSHFEGQDPYDLFEQVLAQRDQPIDPSTAFYLGYEMAKAVTALTLGKTYRQDEALNWGMLTVPELSRRQRRALRMARRQKEEDDGPSDDDREEGCD